MNEKIFKKKDKPEELIRAENLMDEGKLDVALTLLNNYEQKEGLSHYEIVSCQLLQCQILLMQGKLKELIKHAEQTYKESKGLENIWKMLSLTFFKLYSVPNSYKHGILFFYNQKF